MIRIAVAGELVSRLDDLREVSTLRTQVEWFALPLPTSELGKIDIIFVLNGDDPGRVRLSSDSEKSFEVSSLICPWGAVPDQGTLDDAIQEGLASIYGFVLGYSRDLHSVCRWIRAVAHQAASALDLRTLILGESGTGKELVAQAIHRVGGRRNAPFVSLNCAAFPNELVDSELFGHVKGAFTGAISSRAGALRSAENGVLFLDEISDLPLPLQGKFLRVLEERVYSAVGSDEKSEVKAQIISATNRPLDEAVKEGKFRADLYFRIAQISIFLPPLRERTDDIPLLVRHFFKARGVPLDALDAPTLKAMSAHEWPGNIRELRNVMDRFALIWLRGEKPEPKDWLFVREPGSEKWAAKGSLSKLRNDFDRRVVESVLDRCGGNTADAAAELGISRRSVYQLAQRLGINIKKD